MRKVPEGLFYVPRECVGVYNNAVLTMFTLIQLGHIEDARAMIPRIIELRKRAGPSDRMVIVTDRGPCFTRSKPPEMVRSFPSACT